MAGYFDTKKLIEDTLVGRPEGTMIYPEDHQNFALSLLDYIHSVELLGASTLQGIATPTTVPVQPDNAYVSYIATVPSGQTYTFTNFHDENGDSISVTSAENTVSLLTLLWNGEYWQVQVTAVQLAIGYGDGYLFKGIAVLGTDPGTPDQNVFYIAATAGTYTNFGGIVLAFGEVAIIKGSGTTWVKESAGIVSAQMGAMDISGIVDPGTTYDASNSATGTLRASVFYPLDGRSRRFRIELSECVFTENVTQIYVRFTNAITVTGSASVQSCPQIGITAASIDVELLESNLAAAKYLAIFAGTTDAGVSFKAKVTNLDAAAAITQLNGNDLQHSAELIALHGGAMPVSISSGTINTSGATQSIMPNNPPRIRTNMLPIGHLPLTISVPSASVAIVVRVCFYSTFGDWSSFSHRQEYSFNLETKSLEITKELAQGAQGVTIVFANKNGSDEPISVSDGAGIVLTAQNTELDEIRYWEKNTAKVLYSSSPINFDNTAKKVYTPWFGFSNPKAASGRTVIEATEVDYDFSAFTTSAYMLYYNIDTETYSFVATTAPVTERYIPIAAVQIAGDTSLGTGRVVAVQWCVVKDARVDGVSEMTRLASAEDAASYLNVKDKTFMPEFAIFGTIYNGIVSGNTVSCLYNPTFVQVKPGSTIRCFHASGVTLRITEYDEDYTYLGNSGTYSDMSDYALRAETRYVRISAEYSGYSAEDPITADDFQTGDFGFTYGTSKELDRLNAPIYSFYESPWWVDDAQWRKSNYNYGAIIIPVSGAKKLTMTAGTDVNARVAFANTYNPETLSEYDLIDGIGNQGCTPNNTRTLDIPPTCRYIVLSCRYTWNADPAYDANAKPNALPVSLIIDGKEYMKPIEEAVSSVAEKVQNISDIPSGIIGRNIAKDTAVRATGTKVNTSYQTDPIKPLAFIHVSDIHTKGNNYKCFKNCLEFLQHYSVLQFAIVTGDLVWDNFADAMTWYDLALQQTTKPVLNVMGNHDSGQQNNTTPSLDYVSSDVQLYNKAVAPYVSGWGVTQPENAATEGKSYYYKDFTDEKIRLIVLNEFETDYQIDPNDPNKLLYSREYRAMHQAQIDWLISTLSSTPDDYGVVVAYHQPDDNIANDGNPFVSIDLVGRQIANIYSETRDWLPRILNAFATKTADSFTFAQTGAVVGTINVSCDFTANQAEFICILNGHTHRDIIGRLTNYPALLILCIGADNLLYTSNFCPRAEGTPSEDLFNVVNIDRNRKTIKIIRIGSDASITGQVRDQLLIDYSV